MSGRQEGGEFHAAVRRRGSFGRTLKAVLWSFFGIRKGRDLDRDMSELNPVHVAVAGVLAAAVFVVGLVALIQWVVASGIAA